MVVVVRGAWGGVWWVAGAGWWWVVGCGWWLVMVVVGGGWWAVCGGWFPAPFEAPFPAPFAAPFAAHSPETMAHRDELALAGAVPAGAAGNDITQAKIQTTSARKHP